MSKSVKREKTKYKNIYFNTTTKKYDIKYNYKEYDVKTCKNVYKSKWIYNISTITEAKQELANLQVQGVKNTDKELTLQGAYEAWKIKALAQNFSPVTIQNTSNFMTIIYKFIPASTLLKNITEDVYYSFCADIRTAGYSEETLFSLNATFRKIINNSFKKRLISENILYYTDNLKTKQKQDYRIITKEEFDLLDNYFQKNNREYRLLINILYYCGLRIGELLALTYDDFEEFSYYKKTDEKPLTIVPTDKLTQQKHLEGMRVKINKSYVSRLKIEKETKNYKDRFIPLAPVVQRLYMRRRSDYLADGGSSLDKIFNVKYSTLNGVLKRSCRVCDIPPINCHDFRHTFISNLIKKNIPLSVIEKVSGDIQQTILKRYSHMFESDEVMILQALQDL